jgi:hypothetical protein
VRKLALYGVVAAVVVIVALPAPGQSAGVTFRGVVEHSTVKRPKAAAIRIVPAGDQTREADVGRRVEAYPGVLAELKRQGHAVGDVVAMSIAADGAITLYVAD